MHSSAEIHPFFDEATHTVTYLVADPSTRQAAVIDPVLDYDHRSGKVATTSADQVLSVARENGLQIVWILETHAHADHLSSAPHLKLHTGAQIAIGEHIRAVQTIFRPMFQMNDSANHPSTPDSAPESSSGFDRLLRDGETLAIGHLAVEVLHTPGHTPACVSYRIDDAVFVGDTLFMPDYGTARADFPGGSAQTLYQSIQRLLALPPATRLFMCHDYKAPGRDHYAWESSVAEERARNIHVHEGVSAQEFVAMRQRRDATLPAPTLHLPSIQVNIEAGRLPEAQANGVRYLKIPLSMPT